MTFSVFLSSLPGTPFSPFFVVFFDKAHCFFFFYREILGCRAWTLFPLMGERHGVIFFRLRRRSPPTSSQQTDLWEVNGYFPCRTVPPVGFLWSKINTSDFSIVGTTFFSVFPFRFLFSSKKKRSDLFARRARTFSPPPFLCSRVCFSPAESGWTLAFSRSFDISFFEVYKSTLSHGGEAFFFCRGHVTLHFSEWFTVLRSALMQEVCRPPSRASHPPCRQKECLSTCRKGSLIDEP